jgi:hypothetical protein
MNAIPGNAMDRVFATSLKRHKPMAQHAYRVGNARLAIA